MTLTYTHLAALGAPFLLAFASGCHHAVPAMTPASYEAPPAAAPPAAPAVAETKTGVRVSRDILELCGIHDSPTGEAPLFAFDSSALSAGDQHLLDEVAQCATHGPLAGRTLKLVGRADPRGTEAYNLHLGDERAATVEHFLERRGMSASRLNEMSRGALDAAGHDENTWRTDRRVDVDIAND
jgi:peptidoglycan-associated lipoprotein